MYVTELPEVERKRLRRTLEEPTLNLDSAISSLGFPQELSFEHLVTTRLRLSRSARQLVGRSMMAADFDLSTSFIPSLHKPSSLLPIARHRESLLYLIETFPVTIVLGQTGSGKTTQIPQFLEQAGWCEEGKVVAVTQVGEFETLPTSRSEYRLLII